MATVIDSFAVSSSTIRVAFRQSPSVVRNGSLISGCRSLPEFSGLKIQHPSKRISASLKMKNSRVSRGGGTVVCEASKTALDG